MGGVVSTALSLAKAKCWRQLKFLSIGHWINPAWFIYKWKPMQDTEQSGSARGGNGANVLGYWGEGIRQMKSSMEGESKYLLFFFMCFLCLGWYWGLNLAPLSSTIELYPSPLFMFGDRVSLSCQGWSWTHFVRWTDLNLCSSFYRFLHSCDDRPAKSGPGTMFLLWWWWLCLIFGQCRCLVYSNLIHIINHGDF